MLHSMPACPVLQSLSHLTMFETLQHACVSQWMHLKHATIVKVLPCLQALSPHYGYYYFRNNHHLGWVQCSGLFLAITGDCPFIACLQSPVLFVPELTCLLLDCHMRRGCYWSQCVSSTGTEATYADLGHFSRPAIRVSANLRSSTCVLFIFHTSRNTVYQNRSPLQLTHAAAC